MAHPAQLVSLATATPPHVLDQSEVAAAAGEIFGPRFRSFERMAQVFHTAGIARRRAVRPIDWFRQPQGWPERTAVYLEGALALFVEAATAAIAAAGLTPSDIDTVVTVSSTGIATPSLEARAALAMGFRSDLRRVPVFGLGCAGGVQGLALASQLALAQPGSRVLLVVVELCTLAFRLDQLTKANIVATALFGDGAAACVISSGGSEGRGMADIVHTAEHLWPDTLDIMGWEVDPQGFGVIFAQAIPPFAECRFGPAMEGMLAPAGLQIRDIGRFVCHPGGAKVVQALESALALASGALDHERAVLSEFGNMSAPTALFVLERVLAAEAPSRLALAAMGPGFSAACAVLEPTS